MANLLDYIDWRGDLTFAMSPFNEVDNLILAELSFLDFEGIVPPVGGGAGIPLKKAAEVYFRLHPGREGDMGLIVPDCIPDLLKKAAGSARFSSMVLSCFTDLLDEEQGLQFAACTAEVGDGSLYVSFRGTDDTIVGWKEDFNMSFMDVVPAQREAVSYLRSVAAQHRRRKLRIGGHSKGGNLAVYSAVHCGAAIQRRILTVYNNDGPGFRTSMLQKAEHIRIADRITTIVPQSSVVGMIMEHEETFTLVKSAQKGILQHDGFSWEVMGHGFVHLTEDAPERWRNDLTLKGWISGMSDEQRRRFTEGLFDILSGSDAKTLTELTEDGFKTAAAMVKAMADMDKETRDVLLYAFRKLFLSKAQVIQEELIGKRRKKEKKEAKK
ncbi:DUF2974 domain-containing protein [Oscillibacter hominis]|uniref:DUF2974 domain-containing protein n=1 Tax=Oscillibacter hominis TaxID=2763056 RepID=A0A7G9B6C5_9FIRM|nr:DUF2974 domain-containing protein [Oscillibacter hominis]QNL45106.1 DUF2974 domain-containing protein [Oscillibacter hominis]